MTPSSLLPAPPGPGWTMLATIIMSLCQMSGSAVNKSKTRTEFLKRLLEDYDPRISPSYETGNTTRVECDLYVSSFDSISESTMDYVISIFLRQEWQDPRLAFSHLSDEDMVPLDSSMADSLWLPDTFFLNEKKASFHDITKPNRFFRLYKNGTIYYSTRVSLTLSCPMRLYKFPLDTQVCYLRMESYAFTSEHLQLVWKKQRPVEMADNLELPQFRLTDIRLQEDCYKTYNTGKYTCLHVNFILKRDVGFYMIQTYVPSALIVVLSWVSFWINVDAVPARISLGVLTILTMTTQTTGARQSLPRVSYVKAIDVWMSACLLFVFAALLEFAIVNVLSRKEIRRMVTMRRKSAAVIRGRNREEALNGEATKSKEAYEILDDGRIRKETFVEDPFGKKKARNLDKFARRAFPALFLLFNFVYWLTYGLWNPSGLD